MNDAWMKESGFRWYQRLPKGFRDFDWRYFDNGYTDRHMWVAGNPPEGLTVRPLPDRIYKVNNRTQLLGKGSRVRVYPRRFVPSSGTPGAPCLPSVKFSDAKDGNEAFIQVPYIRFLRWQLADRWDRLVTYRRVGNPYEVNPYGNAVFFVDPEVKGPENIVAVVMPVRRV